MKRNTVIVLLIIQKNKKVNSNVVQQISPKQIASKYDEETGLYYIKDEATGEIIFASYDEDDPDFEFYREHPDYNPNPLEPKKTSLEDYVEMEGITNEEE